MRDYYEVLGVGREATPGEIKKAYRRMAHQYHPDKNPGDQAAEDKFKEASRAYQVLADDDKRKKYDRFGHAGVGDGGPGFDPFGAGGGFAAGVGDVFSEIFGDFFGKKQRATRERGRDRTIHLRIDFSMSILGGERAVDVPRSKRCGKCSGTGAKPGTTPQICHACGGSGEIRVQQGLFSVSKRCTYCKGRGRIIRKPCEECNGDGLLENAASLKVKIPKGADNGTTLRYKGEGEPGMGGGAAGDLRVVLDVDPHPVFTRDGHDLHCEMPISFVDAALGGRIDVPTLGSKVKMTVPPGTQSGKVFRLRGKGVPHMSGSGVGDQHVKVILETPRNLGSVDKDQIEALRGLSGKEHYPLQSAFWRKFNS